MSGIVGIVHLDCRPVQLEQLQAMLQTMPYRGPDGMHTWQTSSVGLGHALVASLPQLEGEKQPLNVPELGLTLVLDGWLADPMALRGELLAAHAPLAGGSDAALVLAAYRQWGVECLQHLEGDFAFAIWDANKERLFCARDHLGNRPFCYHFNGDQLFFASEVQGIRACREAPREVDESWLAQCLTLDWRTRTQTFWRGINRLPAAHYLLLERGKLQVKKFWQPRLDSPLHYRRRQDYAEHYLDLLRGAVAGHSRSGAPVAVEVSGGLDSSAVFAVANRLLGEGRLQAPDLRGYTLDYSPDVDAGEIEYVRELADFSGREVRELRPRLPCLEELAALGAASGEFPGVPSGRDAAPMLLAAQAEGCRVILNGLGGDEWLDYCPGRLPWLSGRMRALVRGLIPGRSRVPRPQSLLSDGLARALGLTPGERVARQGPRWLRPGGRWQLATCLNAGLAYMYELNELHCAQHGLESRSPFLSRPLVQFAFDVPKRVLSPGGANRHLHRQAMLGYLPESIRQRQDKADFSVSYEPFIRDSWPEIAPEIVDRRADWLCHNYQAQLRHLEPQEGLVADLKWSLFACDSALLNGRI